MVLQGCAKIVHIVLYGQLAYQSQKAPCTCDNEEWMMLQFLRLFPPLVDLDFILEVVVLIVAAAAGVFILPLPVFGLRGLRGA